jgi:hypothetical protein
MWGKGLKMKYCHYNSLRAKETKLRMKITFMSARRRLVNKTACIITI